ncbi:MAG: hypothetical protein ACFE8L_09165 [Candidatus Hodarchaeota archaeon]
MPTGICLIKWDEVEGGTVYLKYPEDLEVPVSIVQQLQISHNFTESYIITEEKDWNSVSYYNENKEMIIVLVLTKYDDGNDYLELLEGFNTELDKEIKEDQLTEQLESMFHISLDAFRTTEEVITKLSNEVATLKTREYDFNVKFNKITNSDHLNVKSKVLFLLAINEEIPLSKLKEHIKTSNKWLMSVIETLLKNKVIGYNPNKDTYYLEL